MVHLFKKINEAECGAILNSWDTETFETVLFEKVTCPCCINSDRYQEHSEIANEIIKTDVEIEESKTEIKNLNEARRVELQKEYNELQKREQEIKDELKALEDR
jgi:DNA repair exonuclease SbcCD ATPase subunit